MSQCFYSIGVISLASSIFVTFAESFQDGRIFFNRYAWDGTFWDQRESLFVILGVASFVFFLLSYRSMKGDTIRLSISAYIAVIIGNPDVFRAYNGLIWNALREWDEFWFAGIAAVFLAYNVWQFKKTYSHEPA